jgi:hypothetical protein
MCDNFWKREAVGLSLICYGAVDSEIGKKKMESWSVRDPS